MTIQKRESRFRKKDSLSLFCERIIESGLKRENFRCPALMEITPSLIADLQARLAELGDSL
jgi:hypothetical protein